MGSQSSSLALPPAGRFAPARARRPTKAGSDRHPWRRPPASRPSIRASFRAASPCLQSSMKATSETGSPPLSPLAKSAHRPVRKLILKRAQVAVDATRIERDIFVAHAPSAGQNALQDGGQERQRRAVDAVEVDAASGVGTPWARAKRGRHSFLFEPGPRWQAGAGSFRHCLCEKGVDFAHGNERATTDFCRSQTLLLDKPVERCTANPYGSRRLADAQRFAFGTRQWTGHWKRFPRDGAASSGASRVISGGRSLAARASGGHCGLAEIGGSAERSGLRSGALCRPLARADVWHVATPTRWRAPTSVG